MKHIRSFALGFLIFILLGFGTADAQQDLAQQVYAIFEQSCLGCHGPHGSFTEHIVIDSAAGLVSSGAVVPGKPAESELYRRLLIDDPAKRMPLNQPQLSAAAIEKIGVWIQAGTPSWEIQHDVNFITTGAMLTAIQTHLNTLDTFDRPFARYFTMTHLYNAGEVPEVLRAYRVALSKVVNSLSWGFEIINPDPVDAAGMIFYIDLRDYEWDVREAWTQIENVYLYALAFEAETQASLLSKLTYLRREMNCEVPFVHVDWFLATASLPPLYHAILALPETERELERELRIDVARNLQSAPGVRVWRAGTNDSGVSNHNRVLERHTSPYGAYWKSHDFSGSAGAQNIFTHPLSFERDGGEAIFNLPNGLQAYYIADGLGNRIDVAPTEIVSNPAASDPAVRNGLSCIGCHTEGMKDFRDGVRSVIEQTAHPVYDKDHALRLYVEKEVMAGLVAQDTERYRQALEATGGVFGGVEPVHRFYEAFQRPLDVARAAATLGLETETFLGEIREKSSLQRLGLVGLVNGGNVKRDAWTVAFQEIVSAVNAPDTPNPSRTDRVRQTQTPVSGEGVHIPDASLRAVIEDRLGKSSGEAITTQDMLRLDRVEADEAGITDLTGLEHALRLKRIKLRYNAISDLSPLAGLVLLSHIEVRGNKITDISPLSGIKLNEIDLEDNPISNISALAGMTSLEEINVENTFISDFSVLSSLSRLQRIALRSQMITELPALDGLKRLKHLTIKNTRISDISGLLSLTQLTYLNLSTNLITDVSPLKHLKNLTELDLSTNLITDVSPLKHLKNLTELDLSINKISDVSPLAALIQLETLYLRENVISDFSPLQGLVEKTFIHASNNPGSLLQGGPKITGPWLWVLIPGAQLEDFEDTDVLAQVSEQRITELEASTDGATAGNPVGENLWTVHKISSTSDDNINEMLNTLGMDKDDNGPNLVYGLVTLDSLGEQETKMFAGSDDKHKVWLNGELVSENFSSWAQDYQEFFPVTLKKGRNLLLVAIHNLRGRWSGYFGFAPDAEYTVLTPRSRFSMFPPTTPVAVGDVFTLHLKTTEITDLAGWQTDITFDPKVLSVDNVIQGNFLKQDGGRTFFWQGKIQNKQGKIIGIRVARISKGGVGGNGTLLSLRFKAFGAGKTHIKFVNFRAGNSTGETVFDKPPEIVVVVSSGPAAPSLRPDETALLHNYPNPFNPETWIPYQLAEPAEVTIRIYATSGVLVRKLGLGHQAAGYYTNRSRAAYWDGRNAVGEAVASGVYFYTLTAGDFTATGKMLIRK